MTMAGISGLWNQPIGGDMLGNFFTLSSMEQV